MRLFTIPYPNAYDKDNSHYTFTDPVDGQQYEYTAGQDGMDEQWIAIIKKLDRQYNADESRFARKRKSADGTGYLRTVMSLEDIVMDERESSDVLMDPEADTERIVMGDYKMSLFQDAYNRALKMLSDSLRATWILYVNQEMKVDEIAAYLNLPSETIKKRLYRAKKTLQKKILEICPLMASFLTRE